MRVRTAVPLATWTTLRVGGPAARLLDIDREEDVVEAVRDARARAEPWLVLGGGSNVVVSDDGFAGLVCRMAIRGVQVQEQGDHVVVDVGAGEEWDAFVERSVEHGWSGIECLSGIPGLVGATPIQNVGAYGQEVRETIAGVRAFDCAAGRFVDMAPGECGFGYRASMFKRSDRWIVTSVRFVLARTAQGVAVRYGELALALGVAQGERSPPRRVREAVLALRRGKGMVLDAQDPDSVSVGSFFVNPVVDGRAVERIGALAGAPPPRFDAGEDRYKVAAAWLVERAGFPKGWHQGRAGLSTKHALALVNRGGATARDILAAARTIRDGVRARFGIVLEPEPVIVGPSGEKDGL